MKNKKSKYMRNVTKLVSLLLLLLPAICFLRMASLSTNIH